MGVDRFARTLGYPCTDLVVLGRCFPSPPSMAFGPAFSRVCIRTHLTASSLPSLKRKAFRLLVMKRFLTPTVSEGCGSTDFSLWIFVKCSRAYPQVSDCPARI